MSEKTTLEKVEEIWQKVNTLDKRFTIIEQMMKDILNKLNGNTITPEKIKISSTQKTVSIDNTMKIGDPTIPINPNAKVKILGQIKKGGKCVFNVNVKVYDNNNQIIKETRTNKAGEWMSLLPPGKYKAEYKLDNFIDTYVNFNVLPGQTMLRIAQPQEI